MSSTVNVRPDTAIVWHLEARPAFNLLNAAISVTLKMFYVDYTQEIYLHLDASSLGLGQFQSIQFVFKALTETEANYEVQELEAYATIYCIKKLDHYLRSSHFIVHIDHKNLTKICNAVSSKIIRRRMCL